MFAIYCAPRHRSVEDYSQFSFVGRQEQVLDCHVKIATAIGPNVRYILESLMHLLLALSLLALFGQSGNKPIQSAHVFGPNRLEGWTLSKDVENQGPLPMTLVIARGGLVVRHITGRPFLWKWKFESNGELVAFESGPLHFGLVCTLVNIRTGKQVADYDCYRELPSDAPQWVKELEAKAD